MDFETAIAMVFAFVGLIFSVVWLVLWVRGLRAAKDLTTELRLQREAKSPQTP